MTSFVNTVLLQLFLGTALSPPSTCTSDEFRDRFLRRAEVANDYVSSPSFSSFGSEGVRCLQIIAEGGGEALGLSSCRYDDRACKVRALRGIETVATAGAVAYLVDYIPTAPNSTLKVTAIQAVGRLGAANARGNLRRELRSPDPTVRSAAIVALGAIGDRSDRDVLLEATLSLPDEYIVQGIQGLGLLGAFRDVPVLHQRLRRIDDLTIRNHAEHHLQAWQKKHAARADTLNSLASAEGEELIRAIRMADGQSSEIEAALVRLLDHRDPRVRTETISRLAVSYRGVPTERLLGITLELPEAYVPPAVESLVFRSDPSMVGPLVEYSEQMRNLARKARVQELLQVLDDRLAASSTPHD